MTDVYFARAYASYERRTKENQHKFVCRFILKGKRLKDIPDSTIRNIEQWMNNYPRKILSYETAQEAFTKELELLVS